MLVDTSLVTNVHITNLIRKNHQLPLVPAVQIFGAVQEPGEQTTEELATEINLEYYLR